MKLFNKIVSLITHPKVIRLVNILVFITILIDVFTNSVDPVTILLMMFILLDVLVDIRNNNIKNIDVHFHLGETKKEKNDKSKKTTKK